MYHALIFLIIIIDQGIKYLIRASLNPGEGFPIIRGVLHFTHVENSGGAFGILSGQTAALSVVTAVVVTAIAVYIHKERKSGRRVLLAALSLICAGGVGNLIDRVRCGVVTDFIDFRIFPVFNFADICVTCGCTLLLLFIIFFDRKEETVNGGDENGR